MKKILKYQTLKATFLSLLIGVVLSLMFLSGFFSTIQNKINDLFFLKSTVNPNIIIISIDDESINKIGRWPFDRKIHAQLLDNLLEYKPKVIGLDVSFLETSYDDDKLADSLEKISNVVLPIEIDIKNERDNSLSADKIFYPIDKFKKFVKSGFTNTPLDRDGVFRSLPLKIKDKNGEEHNAFVVEILKIFQNSDYFLNDIPLKNNNRLIVNYAGPPNTFLQIPYVDILNKKVDLSIFENKIVLIGSTASDLHDEQVVPTSNGVLMPGVEIHANILNTILTKKFLRTQSDFGVVLNIILISVFCGFIFYRIKIIKGLILDIILILVYLLLVAILFEIGYLINILFVIAVFIFSYFTVVIFKYLSEEREKKKIKKMFQQYVSPQIVDDILSYGKELQLGGVKKEMAIFFSDIRGFTTISEKLSPEELVTLLNEYLSAMTELVFKYRGVVDKYIGDAIMAFWGAPLLEENSVYLACKCSLDMMKSLNFLQKQWDIRELPKIKIGIGINFGEMVVGNMGSNKRFDYTVIGDNVNLGSRLEGLNKEYNSSIIISEFVVSKLVRIKKDKELIFRFLDKVIVKGKKEPVIIYELLSEKDDWFENNKKWINLYQKALEFYLNNDYNNALKYLDRVLSIKPDDGPSIYHKNRIQKIMKGEIKNWQGVLKMKNK